jgi:geranylgeranyl diphosphate synthase type II
MVESRLKAYAEDVERRMEVLLPAATESPTELHEAMRYSALAPGKRLRPALVLASCESVGGDRSAALDAACAIEFVHAFSLVHDDLPALDNDVLRRGQPTCHVKFGEAVAILTGDALFALALHCVAQSDGRPVDLLRVSAVLAAAASKLVNGETIDILSENRQISPTTLRLIHERKTGALISASCEIGAILGGGDEGQIACLRRFGEKVGLAFQIADDVLNATSSAAALGKAAGSDRDRGKATYPALHGLDASREAAHRAADDGIDELSELPNASALIELARFSVERLR